MSATGARVRYSGSNGSGHFVERGISYHVGMDAQGPVDHPGEKMGHLGKDALFVPFGVSAVFPKTVGVNFLTALQKECEFVEEPVLLAEQRDDLVLHFLDEVPGAIWLQVHGYFTCKHGTLLGYKTKGEVQGNTPLGKA